MTYLTGWSRASLLVSVFLLLSGCAPEPVEDSFVGYVEVEWVYVSAPQSGWVQSRPINTGDEVAIGTLLFELDQQQQSALYDEAAGRVKQTEAQALDMATGARLPEVRQLQAVLNEGKAQLEQARLEKERILSLVAQNLESNSRGDAVEANYNVAVARVEAAKQSIKVAEQAGRTATQEAAAAATDSAKSALTAAKWSLDQRAIHSLVSGQVEEVFHYVGEFVTAGAPVLAIRPADSLKVRFFVPQAELTQLAIGQSVLVKADGMDSKVEATVSFIASSAEFTPPVIYSIGSRDKLVFMVEARLNDQVNLHPGLPVDVNLK